MAAPQRVARARKADTATPLSLCPATEEDPETGLAVYRPMCCGTVPAQRYQCGICCCGPGGCGLFCLSLCLQSIAPSAFLAAASWIGGCAMVPIAVCLAAGSSSETGMWKEFDTEDRVILQEARTFLDRSSEWTHTRDSPVPLLFAGQEAAWKTFFKAFDTSTRELHVWTRWRSPLLFCPVLGLASLVVLRTSIVVVFLLLFGFLLGVAGTYFLAELQAQHRRTVVDTWHPFFEDLDLHIFLKEHTVGYGKQTRTYTWIEINRMGTLSYSAGRVLYSPHLNTTEVEAVPTPVVREPGTDHHHVPLAMARVVHVDSNGRRSQRRSERARVAPDPKSLSRVGPAPPARRYRPEAPPAASAGFSDARPQRTTL